MGQHNIQLLANRQGAGARRDGGEGEGSLTIFPTFSALGSVITAVPGQLQRRQGGLEGAG
jgi:hypothetical protein